MISTRFLPIVCGLVAITLVPTFIHSYSDSAVRDGRTTASIPTMLAGYTGRHPDATRRGASAVSRATTGRSASTGPGVTRSGSRWCGPMMPKSLYHHPELAVTEAHFDRTERQAIRPAPRHSGPRAVRGSGGVAFYALQYDGAFVEDPIRFQLRTAGELLFSGRKAMTLFFMADEQPDGRWIESLPSLGLFFGRSIDSPPGRRHSITWMAGVPAGPGTVRAEPDAASTPVPRGARWIATWARDHSDSGRRSNDFRLCSPPVQPLLLHRWIPRHRLRDQRLRGGRLLRRFVLRRCRPSSV